MAGYSHCLTTDLFAMRDRIGVTEISLKSVTDVGFATLGTDVTMAVFQLE